MSTEPTTTIRTGILLPCPRCGEEDATVLLNLAEPDSCHCSECDEDFSLSDIENLVARWRKVIDWIDTMPK